MQIVMCNSLQCPYCQFCVFEDDCSSKDKYDAREESDTKKGYFDRPSCFQVVSQELLEQDMPICNELKAALGSGDDAMKGDVTHE